MPSNSLLLMADNGGTLTAPGVYRVLAQAAAASSAGLRLQPGAVPAALAAAHPSGGWTARFASRASHHAVLQAVLPSPPQIPDATPYRLVT